MLAVVLPIVSSLRATEREVRLVGIVTLGNQPMALLENESAPPRYREFMLLAGQKEERIRVLEINTSASKVKLEVDDKTQEITFAAATAAIKACACLPPWPCANVLWPPQPGVPSPLRSFAAGVCG